MCLLHRSAPGFAARKGVDMNHWSAIHRHSLAWLQPTAIDAITADVSVEWRDSVADWVRLARPFVIRRRCPDDQAGAIPLGLSLPLSQGKQRIALAVRSSDIIRRMPPPALHEVIGGVDSDFRIPLERLLQGAEAIGTTFRVFGSLASQWLTDEQYQSPESDIDLLAAPEDLGRLYAIIELLTDWERETGRKADGEIFFPGGQAVAWRELAQATSPMLLIKTDSEVYLEKSSVLLNQLSQLAEEHVA